MYTDQLQKELANQGIIVSSQKLDSCISYTECVLKENKKLNLTAINNIEDAIWLHIFDSLLILPHLQVGTSLDIGTGGGFPGVLLAIVTEEPWCVLDSKQKKIMVVKKICNDLGLQNIQAEYGRVEDFARLRKESFQNVVVRAVAKTPVLLEYASPLQPIGGRLILTKAPLAKQEREEGANVAELLGYESIQDESCTLPREHGKRELLVYEKMKEAPVDLPRRAGIALKRPLC